MIVVTDGSGPDRRFTASVRGILFPLLVVGICLVTCKAAPAASPGKLVIAAPDQLVTLTVRIARTPESWRDCLTGYPPPEPNSGVLVLFPDERITALYSGGNSAPMELILFNKYSRVTGIIPHVKPGRYYALPRRIVAALFVADGFCARHDIRTGLPMELDGNHLKIAAVRKDTDAQIARTAENLQKNIARYPDDPDMVELLATFYIDSGRLDDAEKIFRRLLRQRETPERLEALGTILVRREKRKEAVEIYQRAFKLDPASDVYARIAFLLAHSEEPEKAVRFLRDAAAKYPGNLAIHLALARYYLSEDNLDAAKDVADTLVKTAGPDPEIFRLAGDIALRNGKMERAARNYLDYLKKRPYDTRAREYRAFITVHLAGKPALKGGATMVPHE